MSPAGSTNQPGSAVAVRAVRWWDVEPLVRLEQQLFGPDAWTAPTWWAELAQAGPGASRDYLLVQDPGGEIVGYGGVSINGPDADVMTLAVSPGRRGTGLGRHLLGLLVDAARAGGAAQLLLEVRADNVPAQRLYLSSGFERIAVRRGYYRTADGPVDAWIMRRRPLAAPSG
jgi:[ribosomal protein S18]-alanine N-acetyltransferase